MEDGVEVVINHLEPYKVEGEPNKLTLEEEYIIDFESEDLAEVGMTDIMGFDIDSDGNIYFWSVESPRDFIFKFDANGKFVSSIGRSGQGPGELVAIFQVRINERDEILVSDGVRKKIIILDASGNLIKEMPIAPNHRITTLLEIGKILAMKAIFKPEEGFTELPIVICNSELEDIAFLHKGERIPNWARAKRINGLKTTANYFPWSISKSHIYIGNPDNVYEIFVYDFDGRLERKIRKKYNPVAVPEDIKERVLKIFESPHLKLMKIKKKVFFPDYMPPFQYFFTDDEGRLFVMTYEKGEGPKEFIYDIFNPDGVFIGRTSLDNSGNEITAVWGGPFEVKKKNKRLYCMRMKDSGYNELVVYRMKWE